MEEIRDYYVFLGVPRNATADDIKRAYARKRREYQNDETKSTQLNQAYEILCDSAKRKQYDINMQFGTQLDELKEKVRNSETLEQRDKYLKDEKNIYLDILKTDAENEDALWNLVGIEELLGNDEQAVQYLKQLEKYVEGDDKLQVYHRLGGIYRKLRKIDEAIKCYHAIYKADVAYVEDIKILVRLCYEDKKNLKAAIQILNDCINRSADSRLKIVYLCETLRAIRKAKNSSYQKVEETLYRKLESFRTDNEESNLANAATILSCIGDLVGEDDFECFHKIEKIFEIYDVKNVELNQSFEMLRRMAAFMEQGKLHKAIELYLEEQWTKEIREEIGRLIIKEAEQIKVSLECIKKEIPEYWNAKEELLDLEKLVNENLSVSKEFNSLSKDRSISYYMKKMMGCILLDGFVAFEDMKDEFIEARDSFFDKEDKGKFQHTLRKMEEYYPICYEIFADIFFEEKSTDELVNGNKQNSHSENVQSNTGNRRLPYFPNAKEGYENKPYIKGFLELLFIVIGTCCFPPVLPIIFILKYYVRHQKSILKVVKRLLVVTTLLLIVVGIYAIYSYIREKQYEENHDNVLTDSELEKIEQLESVYAQKTDVNIIYIQSEESQVEVDGSYILLSYYINHPVWNSGYGLHTRGILTQEQADELGSEILDMLDDESLSDYDKCEKFFEIAYDYIIENDISAQEYAENMQNQEKMKSYSFEKNGTYDVGYSEGLINPGSYTVEAGGDIDNQYNLIYITVYRNGRRVGYHQIGSFPFPVSITLQDGDKLDISYNGKGSYYLFLHENVN